MEDDESKDLSFSQRTLRTEIRLATTQLELSLRKYIGDELEKKASAEVVARLQQDHTALAATSVTRDGPLMRDLLKDSAELRQGEFNHPQQLAIRGVVGEVLEEQTKAGWSRRERVIALAGVLLYATSIAISTFTLLH